MKPHRRYGALVKLSPLPSPLSPLLCLLLLLAGCPKPDSDSKDKPVERPLEGVKLRLAVVDDPALAAAVVRVRGEWNAQTGSELEVVETTEKDLLERRSLAGRRRALPLASAGRSGRARVACSRAETSPAQRRMGRHLRVAQDSARPPGASRPWPSVRLARLLLLLSGRPAGEARPPSAANLGRVSGLGQAAGRELPSPWERRTPLALWERGRG